MREINFNAYRNALALLKSFEGCSLKPYKDIANHYTIGYGHKRRCNETIAPITQEQADALLSADFKPFIDNLRQQLPNLNDCELCALACFSFNVGLSWLSSNTNLGREVLRYNQFHFNKELIYSVCYWMKQYTKYTNVQGQKCVSNGLLRRREAETEFFKGIFKFYKPKMF